MKKILSLPSTVMMLVVIAVISVRAQQYPKATGYVNDFANLLTVEQASKLNRDLVTFENKTTYEIAVVTVPWLNNQSIEDYTRGLAMEWGVGKRNLNNGVVFLIAPKERKMRIETASGARTVLTDARANDIRDTAVLPRFRSGDMAQGIIDGTYAIMRSLDSSSALQAGGVRALSISEQPSQEWTEEEKKTFLYFVAGLVGAILLMILVAFRLRVRNARKYVLGTKDQVSAQIEEAVKIARSQDVKEDQRKRLADIRDKFSSISRLDASSIGVRWVDVKKDLEEISFYLVPMLVSTMRDQIAFADRARREGPELLKCIPGMIETAKRAVSPQSSAAAREYLEQARQQYAEVQRYNTGTSNLDWVMLYMILSSIQTNTARAREEADSWERESNSRSSYRSSGSRSDSSSSSSDSSSSFGFGSNSGFGGGSGFSGGGSSGDW